MNLQHIIVLYIHVCMCRACNFFIYFRFLIVLLVRLLATCLMQSIVRCMTTVLLGKMKLTGSVLNGVPPSLTLGTVYTTLYVKYIKS